MCKDSDSPVFEDGRHFPFCSESCKDRDLGGWLRDQYRIGSRPAGSDELPETTEPPQD
ncbi:MAG: DNA gyrase inhibitor YacG [Planctomycetota bacterium]|nr:DNA gyrase inhibitor YacG [Planctomycetota bacterium]